MTSNPTPQPIPIEAVHLADVIQEEMGERGWTLDELVMHMGPHFTPEEWVVCKLSWEMFFAVRERWVILGDVMAQQLSDAFDVSPEFFNRIHEQWRKQERPQ